MDDGETCKSNVILSRRLPQAPPAATLRVMPQLSPSDAQSLQSGYLATLRKGYAVLKASGPKVRDYLQGQLTQDIALLTPAQGIYSAVLTPQGKPVSDLFLLCGHNDELIIIITPQAQAEMLVGRLRQFAIGYELRCGIVDSLHLVSIQGAAAEAFLEASGLPVPGEEPLAAAVAPGREYFVMRMAEAANDGFWVMTDSPGELLQDHQVDESVIITARIIRGIPSFGIDWDEKMHPLNANLAEFGGVSFDKGCYVGQEVTSRMQWRGGIKKHLYRVALASLPSELPASISTTVPVGTLTSAAADAGGECFGIAHLPIEIAEGDAPLFDASGEPLSVIEVCHG